MITNVLPPFYGSQCISSSHLHHRFTVTACDALHTAADRTAWVVASRTEALLVFKLVEVGAAVDWSSEAGRLAGPLFDAALHLDHALSSHHRVHGIYSTLYHDCHCGHTLKSQYS